MTPHKSNSDRRRLLGDLTSATGRLVRPLAVALLMVVLLAGPGLCAEVSWDLARQVAQNKLLHHVALYGRWNHTQTPTIEREQLVRSGEGVPVAYNFDIHPSGHILVAMDDEFSPILLYSTTSSLDLDRIDDPKSIAAWIVPEVGRQLLNLKQIQAVGPLTRSLSTSAQAGRISKAWQLYRDRNAAEQITQTSETRSLIGSVSGDSLTREATAGPLLETAWGQGAPYNLDTPDDGCGEGHTVTGCVATAWAQLMHYWRWPLQGEGSFSYTWEGETTSAELTADFGATAYDWDHMPAMLGPGSTDTEKEAVALLMYHAGVSAEMIYGCDSSGSSAWADDVLDQYFRYKSTMTLRGRGSYEDGTWFNLMKAELDADPPRPILMAVLEEGGAGGHEIVVDGYKTDPTNEVHINYGWGGNYNGFYNIDSPFTTGPYTWSADDQFIVTGIQPDNTPPMVTVNDDQTVEEGVQVQLTGSAVDPEGAGITSYLWRQTSGPAVTLSDTGSTTPTFTSPDVNAQTDLVFSLRADDVNLAHATQTCTITVNNTDSSQDEDSNQTSIVVSSSTHHSSGSSGGCFLGALGH